MIRFLQTDNRMVKALIVVVIGAASVTMVLYLIPGLSGMGSSSPDTYAIVYPHWYSRILSSGDSVSQSRVEQIAQSQLQQRSPQYANNPMLLQFFEQQVGQQLVQQVVLLQEAHRLDIYATDNDVRQYLRTGPTGEVLYRMESSLAMRPTGSLSTTGCMSRLRTLRIRSKTTSRSGGCRRLSQAE
jgi:peptidyl-prolyl cis-trans isomerase D